MPMDPRLLRPRLGLDPSTAVYLNAVAAADGSQLEAGVRKAIDDFVKGCKRDGTWSSLKSACILMGAKTLAGAIVPLVGTAPTNNNFVSGDYSRTGGLLGNASTKTLDSNRLSDADPQDSFHMSVYASTAASSGTRMYISARVNLTGGINIYRNTADLVYRSRAQTINTYTSDGDATGFIGQSRNNSTTFIARHKGANNTATRTSQSPGTTGIAVFGTGESTSFRSDARMAWYSIGEAIDLALLDARVSALYTAIGAAIP